MESSGQRPAYRRLRFWGMVVRRMVSRNRDGTRIRRGPSVAAAWRRLARLPSNLKVYHIPKMPGKLEPACRERLREVRCLRTILCLHRSIIVQRDMTRRQWLASSSLAVGAGLASGSTEPVAAEAKGAPPAEPLGFCLNT